MFDTSHPYKMKISVSWHIGMHANVGFKRQITAVPGFSWLFDWYYQMMWLLLSALAVLENKSCVKKHSAEGLYSAMKISMHATSAKCNSVRKLYANLPDTLVALTTASKYSQMLPAPPGALQSVLRLCKSILTCSSKHLKWWRCIQDAMRLSIRIVKLWSCRDRCIGLQETSRAAETPAQALRKTWCHIFTAVVFRVP